MKLDQAIQNRLLQRIEILSSNHRPPGVKKLTEEENLYRIRVGEYRVIYQIRDWVFTVVVVKIGRSTTARGGGRAETGSPL